MTEALLPIELLLWVYTSGKLACAWMLVVVVENHPSRFYMMWPGLVCVSARSIGLENIDVTCASSILLAVNTYRTESFRRIHLPQERASMDPG